MFIELMLMNAVDARFVLLPRGDLASPSIDASTVAAHGPSIRIAIQMNVSLRVILLRTPGIQTSARQLNNMVKASTSIQSSRTDSSDKR